MSDTVKVIGGARLRTAPANGLLGHLFESTSADGTALHVDRDASGAATAIKGLSKTGARNELDFSGAWPNEQATFSADGAAYLSAWTTLQQLPEFVVGWNFLFTFGLRSATTEIVYELVLPLGGPRAGDYSPFVARRSVSGKNDGAIRGYYEYPARTFSGLTAIDPNAHIDAPYAVFSLPSVGKPADLSIDSNFQPELQSASFFGTLVPAPSGVTVAPRWLTTRRFLMNMLGTCVQVGGAAGGAAFLGSGGNVGVGVAVGAVGCLAGALGQGIKDLGEFLDQWEQGGGGAGPHPTAGPAGGSSSGSGPIPKDKDQ